MVTGPTFSTFHDAYIAVLRQVASSYTYETETRGKVARETANVSFTIRDPVARSPFLAARRANIVFNHAEALWYLAGRDDVAMIGHYAPRLRTLAADGLHLTGTAYGPRLFGVDEHDGRSQIDRVLRLLRADPDTKRAAMVVMRPDELTDPGNPDVACTLALQFLLRGGALHLTAYMRGNDAVIGLLCDVFSFTFIQEYAARQLDVPVGGYAHHVGSMHVNVLDLPTVDAILREVDQPDYAMPVLPIAAMPAHRWSDLDAVMAWEEALRTNQRAAHPDDPDLWALHPYWRHVILLFEAHRQIVYCAGQPIDAVILAALHPTHRWLLTHRWPERTTGTQPLAEEPA